MNFFEPDVDPNSPEELSDAKSAGWSARTTMTVGQEGQVNQQPSMSPIFPSAEYYTVRFSITKTSETAASPVCTAQVDWLLEGNIVSRMVSVADGVAISGTAQGVSIKLIDATPTNVASAGETYSVVVHVSRGVRPFTINPPSLLAVADPASTGTNTNFGRFGTYSLAPGDFVQYEVPTNAGVNSVQIIQRTQGTGVSGDPAVLALMTDTVNTLLEWRPQDYVGFLALEPGTQHVTITNNDPALAVTVTLNWGVEG